MCISARIGPPRSPQEDADGCSAPARFLNRWMHCAPIRSSTGRKVSPIATMFSSRFLLADKWLYIESFLMGGPPMAAGRRLLVLRRNRRKTSSVPADEPGTLVGLITRSPPSFSLSIVESQLVSAIARSCLSWLLVCSFVLLCVCFSLWCRRPRRAEVTQGRIESTAGRKVLAAFVHDGACLLVCPFARVCVRCSFCADARGEDRPDHGRP